MPATHLHTLQIIVLFLLFVVTVFAALAQRLKLPYPILLTLVGTAIAFLPHVPRIRLDPDLIFVIFLPPLLYAAAWQTNVREFRRNLVSIAMLALGLVAFTVVGVAVFSDRFITALDWRSGLVLGAVISTTDAISATAIAKNIGLPQRIVDILEGESLLNDATGLLALEFGLDLHLRDHAPTLASGSLRLLWLIGGGIGIGLVIARVTRWFERFIEDGPLEMAMSLIVPYTAYLAGEEIHASGVLAVVACGLYLTRHSAQFFSPQARLQVTGAWASLNFILNGFIFVLIGLQLPYVLGSISQYGHWTLLKYGIAFSAVLILLRLVWMFPAAFIAGFVRRRLHQQVQPIPPRELFLIGWTGMRGVVALAAAFSLPVTLGDGTPFAQRDLIVFLTFCIIFVTVVVQGLTLAPIIRALRLDGHPPGCNEEVEARLTVLQEMVTYLTSKEAEATDRHGYEDLLHRYRDRLEALSPPETTKPASADSDANTPNIFQHRREITRDAIQRERSILLRLRDNGAIGDDVQRRLERELDLSETRLAG